MRIQQIQEGKQTQKHQGRNVLLPLCLGLLIYSIPSEIVNPWIRNFVPDICWSFAFASSLQFIWQGKIPFIWTIGMVLFFCGFEFLQSRDLIPGTGDVLDILAYFIGLLLSFIPSNYLRVLNSYEE